jgi:probable HAF family extracellular repeat protein
MKFCAAVIPGLLLGAASMLPAATVYTLTQLSIQGGFIPPFGLFNALDDNGDVAGSAVQYHAFFATPIVVNPFTSQQEYLGTLVGAANDVNNKLQATGYVTVLPTFISHAALWTNGQMTDLGTLGGANSFGQAINASGQVAGVSDTPSGAQHAFLYSNGQMIDIAPPGSINSQGNDINSCGQVAGTYSVSVSDSSGVHTVNHGFLFDNGEFIDLGSLGIGSANAINDRGQVTGTFTTSTGASHAFLYGNGQMMDLGTLPGFDNSSGNGIDIDGEVVGALTPGSGFPGGAAFLWRDGIMQNLNDLIDPRPGLSLTGGFDINDKGQILASNASSTSYVLTPVPAPEPGTIALFTIALAAGLLSRRWVLGINRTEKAGILVEHRSN